MPIDDDLAANETRHYVQHRMLVPPSHAKHLVTLEYLEQKLEGLLWDPVDAVFASDFDGTLNDTFQILTAEANGALTAVDGVTATVGLRVLLIDQTTKTENGIYVITDLGDISSPAILTRAGDANTGDEFKPNKRVWVRPGGTEYSDVYFKQSTVSAVTLGSTNIEFALDVVSRLVEEHAVFTGDGATREFTINHTLDTKYLTYDARDASFVECRFAYAPTSNSEVKVYCGVAVESAKQITVLLRGTAER